MSRHVVFDEKVYPFITNNVQNYSSPIASSDQVLLAHYNIGTVTSMMNPTTANDTVMEPNTLGSGSLSAYVRPTVPSQQLVPVHGFSPMQFG